MDRHLYMNAPEKISVFFQRFVNVFDLAQSKVFSGCLCLFFFLTFFNMPNGNSQTSCSNSFDENNKLSSIHFLKTKTFPIIIRTNHSYRMQLGNGVNGPYLKLLSYGADKLNKNDEVIFVDANQKRQTFVFVQDNESVQEKGVTYHTNTLFITSEDMEWFCNNRVDVIFIKFNLLHTMRKFTLEKARSQELNYYSDCFWKTLDKNMIVDKNIDRKVLASINSKPANTNLPSASKSNTTNTQPNSPDKDLIALNKELDDVKSRVRREIEAELEKLEQVKRELAEQTVTAQKQSLQKKEEFSNEVINARKKADEELNQIKQNNIIEIEKSKKSANTRLEMIAAEVAEARIRAQAEIDNIKTESALKIKEVRSNAAEEIKKLESEMESSRLNFADEVTQAKNVSMVKVIEIRERVDQYIDSLSKAQNQIQQLSAEEVLAIKNNAAEEVVKIRMLSAAEIGKLEENKVIAKEELAIEVAQARKNAEAEINNINENLALQRLRLNEITIDEQEQQMVEIENNRRRAEEEVKKINFQLEKALTAKSNALDSLLTFQNEKNKMLLDSFQMLRQNQRAKMNEASSVFNHQLDSLNKVRNENIKLLEKQNSTFQNNISSLESKNQALRDSLDLQLSKGINDRLNRFKMFKDSLDKEERKYASEMSEIKKERKVEFAQELENARKLSETKIKEAELELLNEINRINERKSENNKLVLSEYNEKLNELHHKLAEEEAKTAHKIAAIKKNLAGEEELLSELMNKKKNNYANQIDSLKTNFENYKIHTSKNLAEEMNKSAKMIDSIKMHTHKAFEEVSKAHVQRMYSLDSLEKARLNEINDKILKTNQKAAEEIVKTIKYKEEELDVIDNQFKFAVLEMENTKNKIAKQKEIETQQLIQENKAKRDSLNRVYQKQEMDILNHFTAVRDSIKTEEGTLILQHNKQMVAEKEKFAADVYEARRISLDQINEIKRTTLKEAEDLEVKIKEREAYLESLELKIKSKENEMKNY